MSFRTPPAKGRVGSGAATLVALLRCWLSAAMSTAPSREERVGLTFTTHTVGVMTVLGVHGDVDVDSAPELRAAITQLVEETRCDLVIDMQDIGFMDSTGLGVLVGSLKRIRTHDGSLRLVCTREATLRLFQLTGLTKVFRIYDTVEAAVDAPRPA